MNDQERKDFLLERATGLGGSDVGALYNIGYGCRRQKAYEKSGTAPDFTRDMVPEFERGHLLEPVIAELYQRKSKRKVEIVPVSRRQDKPWMLVHMDRVTYAPENAGPGYLEIKCVNWRVFKQFKKEGLREEYILQMQHGLAVTGYTWGSFAVLSLDPWQFAWFDVQRDEELIAKLEQDEERFMDEVALGASTERLPIKDRRCSSCSYRATCHGDAMLEIVPQTERSGELPERQDLAPLAYEVKEIQDMADDVDQMLTEAKGKLNDAIGEGEGCLFSGGRVIKIRPSASIRWESRELNKLYEAGSERLKELLKKYRKMSKAPAAYIRTFWTGDK